LLLSGDKNKSLLSTKNISNEDSEFENEYFEYFNLHHTEKDKYILSEGGCFGDLDIINKQKRTFSAKIIESCVCLTIDGINFYNIFSKKIIKSAFEREKFLKKKINIFEQDSKLFNDFLKRVKIQVIQFKYF